VKSQLRLKLLLPLVAVAVLGLGVSRFALGGDEAEPVPAPEAAATGAAVAPATPPVAEPAAPPASPDAAAKPKKAKKSKAKADNAKKGAKSKKAKGKKQPALPPEEAFQRALSKNAVLVAIFYSRDSQLDDLATREARAGAQEAGAGFIAIDVLDEEAARAILGEGATVRDTPTVMVFTGTVDPVSELYGFTDRDTVAQAADNAAEPL
jgi:hypothetical protein